MAYRKINEFLTEREAKMIEDLDHNIAVLNLDLTDARKQRRRIMSKARSRRDYRESYGLGSSKPNGESVRL